MGLSAAEIKRQILMSAGQSDLRRKMDSAAPGIPEGEMIEMGNCLEAITKMPGWNLIESYMLRRMNLVSFIMADPSKIDPDQKGISKAFIELMQWIQLTIQKRDQILEKERLKHGKAESIPEDERE